MLNERIISMNKNEYNIIENWINKKIIDDNPYQNDLLNTGYEVALLEIKKYLYELYENNTAYWYWDKDAMDWGLGAWCCSACKEINSIIPCTKNINPYMYSGSQYCPHCGKRMI